VAPASGRAPAYRAGVDARASERAGALAGLVASVAVGVPVFLDTIGPAPTTVWGPVWLWWACYLGYLVAFVLLSQVAADRRPGRLEDRVLLATQGTLGAVAYALAPVFGWAVVLLIVTAATAAYELSRRGAVAVVVAQMALVAAVSTRTERDPVDAALSVVVYTSFQVFAVVVIWTQQREAEARTQLAETHAELQATIALLEASSRSAERLRIARDLHDLVGHQLTALVLELEAATHAADAADPPHVQRARGIAKELLGDVREAVSELRSQQPGLRDALAAVTDDVPHLHVTLTVDDHLEVDDRTTLAVLRCVQEIVTNTVRHADADELCITVTALPDGGLRLAAQDDGRGVGTLHPGNGLRGIRERIEALGGTATFRSEPGRGMYVTAEVPR
jgi:signal transduction histidine kinase